MTKLRLQMDISLRRRDDFLYAADKLNEWLILREGGEPHHLINRWQIVSRNGLLKPEDRSAIRCLKRKATQELTDYPIQIEISCAILLEDDEEVEYCLQQLTGEDLEQLQTWPIWTLRKMNGSDNGK